MQMRFEEEMAGTYESFDASLPGGEFSFRIRVTCDDVRDPRVIEGRIEGDAFLAGVVKDAPLLGTITISPVWRRTIAYAFTFQVAGKPWRFAGQKDVKPWALLKTMTTLPGTIYDDTGKPVAKAVTTFNARRDMLAFLRSYRFSKAGGAAATA